MIDARSVAEKVMVAIGTFVPTKCLLWAVLVAAIVAFLVSLYLLGYHYVWEKIDGIW